MKKSVSLVLGSGGARGYAHIGVIDALEAQGYEITSVSGSSMGALIGGLYACGKLEAYREWVLSFDILDVLKLVDFSFGGSGIIRGDKVFDSIETMIGGVKIEELPIPFTAVATDIKLQKEVWFQKGRLIDAIRASIAIPSVFTPKKIGDRLYVDGGVLNPLPTVPLLASESDLTIAVNLNGEKSFRAGEIRASKPDSIKEKAVSFIREKIFSQEEGALDAIKILSATVEAMQNRITRYELAAHMPDITVTIPANVCDFYDFHQAQPVIAYGKKAALEALERYEKESSDAT